MTDRDRKAARRYYRVQTLYACERQVQSFFVRPHRFQEPITAFWESHVQIDVLCDLSSNKLNNHDDAKHRNFAFRTCVAAMDVSNFA